MHTVKCIPIVICSFLVKPWKVLRRFRWFQELLDNLGSEIDAAYEVREALLIHGAYNHGNMRHGVMHMK